MWLSYSSTLAKFQDGRLAMSSDVLRHFRLLQSEFLGCMKLKDSAQGDVTHMTSHRKFVSPTTAKTTLIFTSGSKLPYKCEAPTTFSLEASLWFSLVWFFPQRFFCIMCVLVQIFYKTGAPCRDWWHTSIWCWGVWWIAHDHIWYKSHKSHLKN